MDIREMINKVKNFKLQLTEGVTKDDYLRYYTNKINNERDNLLLKVTANPDFVLVLGADMEFAACGDPNKCETNAYNFVKSKLENNEYYYFPVGGFYFTAESLFPVEHWWVYNLKTKKHIEITPMGDMRKPSVYAGIINRNINDDIATTNRFFDVDFFKSGNVYSRYFK